jgi:hypothetical protein
VGERRRAQHLEPTIGRARRNDPVEVDRRRCLELGRRRLAGPEIERAEQAVATMHWSANALLQQTMAGKP